MPAEINAEVGSPTANSYSTVAEADAYHEARLDSDTWDNAIPDLKVRALITATRLLDEHMDWDGSPTTSEQNLAWPRVAAFDCEGYLYDHLGRVIESNEIPQKLKDATVEFARLLLDSDRTVDSTEGVSAVQVGTISVSFSETRPAPRKVVPDAVFEMVSQWGSRYNAQSCTVPLVRV